MFRYFLIILTALPASAQISSDFENWLDSNGYASYNFERDDLVGGSYGGRDYSGQPVNNQPVIFIHGNSDRAAGGEFGGWLDSIDYFKAQGYTNAELYATTWGPADGDQASNQYHSRDYVTRIRAFILAVKAYTGASKVDVIGHSMGVTLGRKAIKGGWHSDLLAGGSYYVGNAITGSIDTFVGIAGANQGLVACYLTGPTTPTCGSTNGLYPGYLVWGLGPYGVSDILTDLNNSSGYEGSWVFSIWSTADGLIGYNNLVYGKRTSRIPGQDGERTFAGSAYDHFGCKDLTGYYQWRMVTVHATN
ncbi:MAG: lipase family protein [Acidobacteriota bacterium]|nr:lipase family protein [Acidobacteriota bacterium]